MKRIQVGEHISIAGPSIQVWEAPTTVKKDVTPVVMQPNGIAARVDEISAFRRGLPNQGCIWLLIRVEGSTLPTVHGWIALQLGRADAVFKVAEAILV